MGSERINTLGDETEELRNVVDAQNAIINDVQLKADQAIAENVTLHGNQAVLVQAVQSALDVATLLAQVL